MQLYHHCIQSPLGQVLFTGTHTAITGIRFQDDLLTKSPNSNQVLLQAADELLAYFSGTLRQFSFPVACQGTPFQQRVWKNLQQIPFGHTISYKQLALQLGDVKCIRAAAAANAKNPLAIVIPCHRVVGSQGQLTGYAGGLHRKHRLLQHEATIAGTLLV